MLITPVDHYQDLFIANNVLPEDLVKSVLATDWLNLPWHRQPYQEHWLRRRIEPSSLPWIDHWHQCLANIWPCISQMLDIDIGTYPGSTAWWVDEPGFVCDLHTDGEMPGAMQLTWMGADNLGTTFFHYKNTNCVRYQFPMRVNCGYIMINQLTDQSYRHLQWHAMLTPVPPNSFRVTSYSHIKPKIS